MKINLLIFLLTSIFYGCSDNNTGPEYSLKLLGIWVNKSSEGEIIFMEKSLNFEPQTPGFYFGNDGKFIERKINGWCGTPPVYYENYEGSWEEQSKDLLKISVGFWGGTEEKQIQIVSLTASELKFKYIY